MIKKVVKKVLKAKDAPEVKSENNTDAQPKRRGRRIHQSFEPLFSKKSVDETRDPLLKVLKLVSTFLGKTNEEFGSDHALWFTSGFGKGSKSPMHNSLNNYRGAITDKHSITIDTFIRVLYGFFRLKNPQIHFSFDHPFIPDKRVMINSSDTYDEMKKLHDEEVKKAKLIS